MIKKRKSGRTDFWGTISVAEIKKAFNLPENAKVFVHIPGGGNYSNEDLELSDLDRQFLEASWYTVDDVIPG